MRFMFFMFWEKSEIEPDDSLVNYPYITFISSPVARIKCWQLMFLQTTDTLAFVKATYHVNSFSKCLITHSHYMIMTLMLYREVEATGVELHVKEDAKPLTAVQDCRSRDISCHVCVNPRRANTRLFWTSGNVMVHCQHWFWQLERHNVQIIVIFKNKWLISWW